MSAIPRWLTFAVPAVMLAAGCTADKGSSDPRGAASSASGTGGGGSGLASSGSTAASGSGGASMSSSAAGAGGAASSSASASGPGGATASSSTAGAGGAGGGASCADPNAGIGWAGDWGMIQSHACTYSPGINEPVTFEKSAIGNDCMMIAADVWVPGLTDNGGDPSSIRAEVVTDLGHGLTSEGLGYGGKVGNNYRYVWNAMTDVGLTPVGSYPFWFHFSVYDANKGCWYRIDQSPGPAGGAPRTLKIVTDFNMP